MCLCLVKSKPARHRFDSQHDHETHPHIGGVNARMNIINTTSLLEQNNPRSSRDETTPNAQKIELLNHKYVSVSCKRKPPQPDNIVLYATRS